MFISELLYLLSIPAALPSSSRTRLFSCMHVKQCSTMSNRKRESNSYIDEWKSLWEPDVDALAYNGATCDPTRVDPKILDWVRDNCTDHLPRFVKIINRKAAHGQPGLVSTSPPLLSVPGPFVEEHYRNLQRVVTLEKNGEPGKTWKVAFLAASRHPLWSQGWRHVARDNNLKPGDVMVFELLRNSHFRFTLFDEDGNINGENSNISTLNHAPAVTTELIASSQSHGHPSSATHSGRNSNPRVTQNRVTLSDDSNTAEAKARPNSSPHRHISTISNPSHILKNDPDVPTAPQLKRRRRVKLSDEIRKASPLFEAFQTLAISPMQTKDCEGCGVDSVEVQILEGTESPSEWFDPLAFTYTSKRRPVTAAERQRAKALAEAHTQVTTSPNFLVVMLQSHVYGRFQLLLPDKFLRESGFPITRIRMTLEDCRGKTWEVYGRENSNFQIGLVRKGWAWFALEHLLEEGDVCVFELADKDARSILVRIFRVVQIPEDDGRTSFHDHYEMHKKAGIKS